MFAKGLWNGRRTCKSLNPISKRGLYAPGTEPKVFINKHTKVICQGMTGKHVRYLLKSKGSFHTEQSIAYGT